MQRSGQHLIGPQKEGEQVEAVAHLRPPDAQALHSVALEGGEAEPRVAAEPVEGACEIVRDPADKVSFPDIWVVVGPGGHGNTDVDEGDQLHGVLQPGLPGLLPDALQLPGEGVHGLLLRIRDDGAGPDAVVDQDLIDAGDLAAPHQNVKLKRQVLPHRKVGNPQPLQNRYPEQLVPQGPVEEGQNIPVRGQGDLRRKTPHFLAEHMPRLVFEAVIGTQRDLRPRLNGGGVEPLEVVGLNVVVPIQKDQIAPGNPPAVEHGVAGAGGTAQGTLPQYDMEPVRVSAAVFLQKSPRPVCGKIIVDQDLKVLVGLSQQLLQAGDNVPLQIVRGDGHCDLRHKLTAHLSPTYYRIFGIHRWQERKLLYTLWYLQTVFLAKWEGKN